MSADQAYPTDWSRDGRFILGHSLSAETRADVWLFDLSDSPTAARPQPIMVLVDWRATLRR